MFSDNGGPTGAEQFRYMLELSQTQVKKLQEKHRFEAQLGQDYCIRCGEVAAMHKVGEREPHS